MFTATVAGSGSTPTGTVSWILTGPGAPTCADSALDASGAGTCTVSDVQAGDYSVTASYSGDTNYTSAEGTDSATVGTATPTVAVSDNSAGLTAGGDLMFTATVAGSGSTPTGTVSWILTGPGSPTCADSTLDASGVGTCTVSDAAAGGYSVTASYSGDTNYNSAEGTDSATVGTATPTVAVSDNSAGLTAGGDLMFTATVAGSGSTPTGTVTWILTGPGSPTCVDSTLDASGVATCTVSDVQAGDYSVTASYSGDTNYSSADGTDSATVAAAVPEPGLEGGTGLGDGVTPVDPQPCNNSGSSPVNCGSGDFWHTFTDLEVPGRGIPLELTRTYNSLSAQSEGIFGYGWSSSYDASLALNKDGSVTVSAEDGSQVTATPLGGGAFSVHSWADSTLTQNADGTYTFVRHQTETLTFSSSGKLIRLSDPNGYTTTMTYNGSGQLSSVTNPAGRSLVFSYGKNGLVSAVRDPIGRTVSYAYDSPGDLTRVTNVGGRSWSFTYGSAHLLLKMTDPRGSSVTNVFDATGRVTRQSDPMGRTTTYAYSGDNFSTSGGSTTVTDPKGNVETKQYVNGLLMMLTKGAGTASAATWTYSYDSTTLGVASLTDPDGHTTRYTYDGSGNVLTKTDPLGRSTSYMYSVFNEPLTVTDPMGVTTTCTYDGSGNLLTQSLGGRTTTYVHADRAHPGDVTSIVDPEGHTTTFTYDADGDRTSATDPDGHTARATYDVIGRKLSSASSNGNRITYTYDAFGDMLSTRDPLGHVTFSTYDADQNLVLTVDPSGHTTSYTYDTDNEVTSTRRSNRLTTNTYDADGNVIKTIDADGHTTTSTYDALNRQISTTDPLEQTTTSSYDPAGNLVTTNDPSGRLTTDVHDADGELTSISYSDGKSHNVSYTYDADGRRTSMTDGTGTTTYAYDEFGELTASTDGDGATVRYAYNPDGLTTLITYPNGEDVSQNYDAAGLETSLNDGLGHTSTFSYDADGNLTKTTLGSSAPVTDSYTYNADDAPISITDASGSSVLQRFTYSRNADSLVSSATQTNQPTVTYSYDALNQLTQDAQGSDAYDPAGNLIKLSSTTSLAYNAGDELTSSSTGKSGATTYSYDAERQRTATTPSTGPASNLTFDQTGNLTRYSHGSTSATYAYNGDGLRMAKSVGGSTTAFTWDTAVSTPLLLSDATNNYIYGPTGLPLEQSTTSGELFFHHDQLGSTTMLTNGSGATVGTYRYGSYGTTLGHKGSATTPFLYAGQYQDAESGLYYLQARYYDPSTGQFMSVDPVVAVTGQPYSYAGDSPIAQTDPSGLINWKATAAVSGTAALAVGVCAFTACIGDALLLATADLAANSVALTATLVVAHQDCANGWSSDCVAAMKGVVVGAFNGGLSEAQQLIVDASDLITSAVHDYGTQSESSFFSSGSTHFLPNACSAGVSYWPSPTGEEVYAAPTL
jgi:RHS repeat-associated protein